MLQRGRLTTATILTQLLLSERSYEVQESPRGHRKTTGKGSVRYVPSETEFHAPFGTVDRSTTYNCIIDLKLRFLIPPHTTHPTPFLKPCQQLPCRERTMNERMKQRSKTCPNIHQREPGFSPISSSVDWQDILSSHFLRALTTPL